METQQKHHGYWDNIFLGLGLATALQNNIQISKKLIEIAILNIPELIKFEGLSRQTDHHPNAIAAPDKPTYVASMDTGG